MISDAAATKPYSNQLIVLQQFGLELSVKLNQDRNRSTGPLANVSSSAVSAPSDSSDGDPTLFRALHAAVYWSGRSFADFGR